MREINLDAKDVIAGRLASYAAKHALLGYTINVFNCESAVMSGTKRDIRARYQHLIFDTGRPRTGPFISRQPDRFMRHMIRGMVQHKRKRGAEAYARVMCYLGVPAAFAEKKLLNITKKVTDLPILRYVTIKDLCNSLGGKV